MRELGVQRLIASCLNDACRHQALIDVSNYPAKTEVPSFGPRVVCAKCGSRGNKIDVRPNWKEQPSRPSVCGMTEPGRRGHPWVRVSDCAKANGMKTKQPPGPAMTLGNMLSTVQRHQTRVTGVLPAMLHLKFGYKGLVKRLLQINVRLHPRKKRR
jgi:hypothetical protein